MIKLMDQIRFIPTFQRVVDDLKIHENLEEPFYDFRNDFQYYNSVFRNEVLYNPQVCFEEEIQVIYDPGSRDTIRNIYRNSYAGENSQAKPACRFVVYIFDIFYSSENKPFHTCHVAIDRYRMVVHEYNTIGPVMSTFVRTFFRNLFLNGFHLNQIPAEDGRRTPRFSHRKSLAILSTFLTVENPDISVNEVIKTILNTEDDVFFDIIEKIFIHLHNLIKSYKLDFDIDDLLDG